MRWWNTIWSVGLGWNQEARCLANLLNHGLTPCPMTLLIKDHKTWSILSGEPPQTRSVMGGNVGGNTGISEFLSLVMEPVAREQEGNMEINATSGLLNDITTLNKDLRQEEGKRVSEEIVKGIISGILDGVSSHQEGIQPPTEYAPEEISSQQEGEDGCPSQEQRTLDEMSSLHEESQPPAEEVSSQQFEKNDIRAYLAKSRNQAKIHGDVNKDITFSVQPNDEPVDKMRMIRNKMADSRRKEENRATEDALILRRNKSRPDIINGQKVTYATDVDRSLVQDEDELVLVGADVISLFPSMVDIDVANLCYDAVMASKIKFSSIDYRKARLYIASNMNKTDQRLSPLWRVLPRRKSGVGGVRPGVTASPECEENWIFPVADLTDLEEKMIMATVIKIGVIVMMNSHVYEFNGDIFLQRAGGPIGLRSTCAVARVMMNVWDARWMEVVNANNIRVRKSNRYMDDIRCFLKAIREGWRWVNGHLCHTKDWENEDMESGISPSSRTARVLVGMMNDVFTFLKFTTELAEHFSDIKLPSFDTNVCVADRLTILFEYYGKPMATNLMVQAESALSKDIKLSSLSEEITRRLRNTSLEVDTGRKVEILEEACTRMKTSGHQDSFIREAVTKGIQNFRRSNLLETDRQYLQLYQYANWRKNMRSKTKAMKRKTWFLDKEEDGKSNTIKTGRKGSLKAGRVATSTVVFVPNTRAGLQETEGC